MSAPVRGPGSSGRPLAACELPDGGFLIGAQCISRARELRHILAQDNRRTLALEVPEVGAVLCVACKRGQLGREGLCDIWRIGQPEVFVRLEPAKAVADDHCAADRLRPVGTGSVNRRAQKADCRTGITLRYDRISQFVERLNLLFMCSRIDPGCPVLLREARDWPHHIQKVFVMTLDPRPHIVITVRKLFDFTRVDFDRLSDIKLNPVARWAQDFLRKRQNDRVENEPFSHWRAAQQTAKTLGPVSIKIAVTKRGLFKLAVEIGFKFREDRSREQIGYDAIAIAQEALCPPGLCLSACHCSPPVSPSRNVDGRYMPLAARSAGVAASVSICSATSHSSPTLRQGPSALHFHPKAEI